MIFFYNIYIIKKNEILNMKYLKKFESYSPINEEEEILKGAKKFFTGFGSKEEKEEAKENFVKALDEAEALVEKDPKGYVFNRKNLEKIAKDNNYKGGLRIQKGGRDASRIFIVYDKGVTGFSKAASAASTKVDNPLN